MTSEIAKMILTSILGEYLDGIDSNSIGVGLWNGSLQLDNMKIKSSAFDKFNLPIIVKYGKIGKIDLSIPYKSLLLGLSANCVINLENIKIYTKTNPKINWKFFDYNNYKFKLDLIKSITENLILQMKISENPKLNNTYINGLINNIIDNIIINIKSLTIIHEDDTSHPKFKFFLGLRLEEISFNSKNEEIQKACKILLIKNLSLFLIPFENQKIYFDFILNYSSDTEFFSILENLSENYLILNDPPINYKGIAPPTPLCNKIVAEKKILKDFLIFSPFNMELDLYRDRDLNKYKIDIMIDNFILDLERKQFACLLKLFKTFGKYSEFYQNCYMFRKLNYFKPSLKLLEVPKNLDQKTPAYIAITEQNKIIKKKYYKEVLRNFVNNVKKMINEKRLGVPLCISLLKLENYKKFFQENYQSFFFDPDKFEKEESNKNITMTELIRYVETETIKNWIKEIVGEIYTNQKFIESKKGFFGGIKNYFYTSAIETIKYDEKKLIQEKEISVEARFVIKLSCFAISESNKKNGNDVKNSSKFLIKNLDFFITYNPNNQLNHNTTLINTNLTYLNPNIGQNVEEREKSQYLNLMDSKISQNFDNSRIKVGQYLQVLGFDLFITDFSFNFTTKVLETEFCDEIIIPLNKIKETDHIFIVKFTKDNCGTSDLQVNLLSQAFRYNHNFIENISHFFNLEEFERYSDLINIKTSNLLNLDLENLQKYYFDNDFKNKKSEVLNFSVKINNQILIIPFQKGKNSLLNDAFIFDIGELSINNFRNLGPFNQPYNPNSILNFNDSYISLDDQYLNINNSQQIKDNNDSLFSPINKDKNGGDLNNSNYMHENIVSQIYNFQINKCKFEYYPEIENFWKKYKFNKNFRENTYISRNIEMREFLKENNENQSKSIEIIQEFILYLKIEINNDTKCLFEISQININMNNNLINKFVSLQDVFKIDNKAELFERNFKTRGEIVLNCTKRGKIDLIMDDKTVKYYTVLAGGYVYLLENIDSEFAKFSIPLKHLEVLKDTHENKLLMKLNDHKSNKGEFFSYTFSFERMEVLDSWISAINSRKSQIDSLSEKVNVLNIQDTDFNLDYAISNDEIREEKKNDVKLLDENQLKKIKEFVKLFNIAKSTNNLSPNNPNKNESQKRIDLEVILDKIAVHLHNEEINASDKFSIEFEKFNLNTSINNHFISFAFELNNIDLKYSSYFHNQIYLLLCSKREISEKLIRIKLRLVQNETWDLINGNFKILKDYIESEFNPSIRQEKSENHIKLNDDEIKLKIRNEGKEKHEEYLFDLKTLSKVEIEFNLSNMTLNFYPIIINSSLKTITKVISIEDKEKYSLINIDKERKFSDDPEKFKNISQPKKTQSHYPLTETNFNYRQKKNLLQRKEINKESELKENEKSKKQSIKSILNLLSLEFTFKSLDILIFNKKTNLLLFSFGLSESKVSISQTEKFLEILLNLGNFIVSEHLNFPHFTFNVSNMEENQKALFGKSNEILGLVDKNKNSSLVVKLNILNEENSIIESSKRTKITVDVQVESIKLNIVYKTILRIVDCIMIDIIESFKIKQSETNKNDEQKILEKVKEDDKLFNNSKSHRNLNLINTNKIDSSYQEDQPNHFENFEINFKKESNLIDFIAININILNPTILLYDLYKEQIFYKLDFGKIKVSNSLDIRKENKYYYENLIIEFNNVNIFSWDEYSVCNLSSIIIKKSSLNFTDSLENCSINENINRKNSNSKDLLFGNMAKSVLIIKIDDFDIKLRKIDYVSILGIMQNNFSVDDKNDKFLFDKLQKIDESEREIDKIEVKKFEEEDKMTEIKGYSLDFSLSLTVDNFKFRVIDDRNEFLEFMLVQTGLEIKNFSDKDYIKINSRNISLKDNQISIISNKKGSEDSQCFKNYSQLNILYEKYKKISVNNYNCILSDMDISLIDLKFFVKLDLIKFISKFLKLENEKLEENYSNDLYQNEKNQKSTNNEKEIMFQENEKIKSKTNIKISISNNIFFLRSENHFKTQQILSLEGDIFIDLILSDGIIKEQIICEKEYLIDENISIECALQNFSFFSSIVDSFESDFEKLYNRKILIEPANFFVDFRNKLTKDREYFDKVIPSNNMKHPKFYEFEKKEAILDIDKIKLKVSFNDIFFIVNTILFNLKKMTEDNKQTNSPRTKEKRINISNSIEKEENKNNENINKIKEFPENKNVLGESISNIDNFSLNESSQTEKVKYNKFNNLIEIFLKFSNLEILIINDLNNMFCPIFTILLSETEVTIFQDLSQTLKCNIKSSIKFDYFNYKISFWEPAIEKFDFLFLLNDENYSLSIMNEINLNINQELIFLLRNSIESLKNKYDKQHLIKDENEINVSNNMLINYSGDEIVLMKKPNSEKNSKEYLEKVIPNGESFDLDALNMHSNGKNLYFENIKDKEGLLLKNKFFDNVTFRNRNINLKNFSLDDPFLKADENKDRLKKIKIKTFMNYSEKDGFSSEKSHPDEIEKNQKILEENNLECKIELDQIRKNYIFFSNFIFSNQTQFSIHLEILNKFNIKSDIKNEYFVKKLTSIGIREFKQNLVLILKVISDNNNNSNDISNAYFEYEIPYESAIEYVDKFIEINVHNFSFIIKIEKIILNNFKESKNKKEFFYYKLTLLPTIRLKNILPFEVNLLLRKNLICKEQQESELNLLTESEIDLFCSISTFSEFDINCNGFLVENFNLNINPNDFVDVVKGSNSDEIPKKIIKSHEKIYEVTLFSSEKNGNIITNNEIKVKINIARIDGVYEFFFYSDYIVVNLTDFNIIPMTKEEIKREQLSQEESIQMNDKSNNFINLVDNEENRIFSYRRANKLEFKCENSKNLKYFLLNEFFRIKLMIVNSSNQVFLSQEINIIPDNYAFTGEVILSNHDYPDEKYQLAVERVIKYFKFKSIKKIDLLIIKPKFTLLNNLNYDVLIGKQIIKAKEEKPFFSEKSIFNLKLIKNQIFESSNNTTLQKILHSNSSEDMKLDSFFENHIVLNFDDNSKVYFEVKNEIKGINSVVTLNPSNLVNSEFLIENKTNYYIKLSQNLPTINDLNYNNYIIMTENSVNFYNWTKINITRYLKIDVIDKSNLKPEKSKDSQINNSLYNNDLNMNIENSLISELSEGSMAISKNYSNHSLENILSVYSEQEINANVIDSYVLNFDDVSAKYKNEYNKLVVEFSKYPNIRLKVKFEGETCFMWISERQNKECNIFDDEYKEKKMKEKDDKENPRDEKLKPNKISNIILNVKCVNISILTSEMQKQSLGKYAETIHVVKNIRKELINIQLYNLSLISITEIKNKFEKAVAMQFKLKSLQVDNVTENSLSPYKINIFKIINTRNSNYPTDINEDDDKNKLSFIDFIFEYKNFKYKNKETIHIDKLDFLVQSLGICIDSVILYELLIFIKSLKLDINTTFYSKSTIDIFENLSKNTLLESSLQENFKGNLDKNKNKDYKKLISENRSKTSTGDKLYIEFLRTSPINILLSYKNINDKFFEELNINSSIIKNIIDLFSNNENVNIKLNAIEFSHIHGSSSEIIGKIVEYYSKNLFYQVLKLLFSIDILGNPLKLLTNFGSGVKDFFYLPIQGLKNGPLDFVLGSYSGTKSLVSHTVGGVFDSTEKITFSIKKYLLKITNSDDYNRERQNLYNGSLEGKTSKFMTSMKIIVLGIKYGFRDLLFFPYFYCKNWGILSLPKGIIMGITSLFVKPVSGCLDFLSFFSGNIAKNFLNSYDYTYKNINRKRDTRIFWGKNKYISSLNDKNNLIDKFIKKSTLISFLKQHDKLSDMIYHINDPDIIVRNVFFARKAEEKNNKVNYTLTLIYFVNDYMFVIENYKDKENLIINMEKKNFLKMKSIKNVVSQIAEEKSNVIDRTNFPNNEKVTIFYEDDSNYEANKIFRTNDSYERIETEINFKTKERTGSLLEKSIFFDSPHIKSEFLNYIIEKLGNN